MKKIIILALLLCVCVSPMFSEEDTRTEVVMRIDPTDIVHLQGWSHKTIIVTKAVLEHPNYGNPNVLCAEYNGKRIFIPLSNILWMREID